MKATKNALSIINMYSEDQITIKALSKYVSRVNSFCMEYDYELNQHQFDALVSAVYSGIRLEELSLQGMRTTFQIGTNLLKYDNHKGIKDQKLRERRIIEFNLFFEPEV